MFNCYYMQINNLESPNDEIIELNQLYFFTYNIIENRNPIRGFGGNTAIKKCKKLFVKASGECQDEVLNQSIFIQLNFEYLLDILKS